MNTFTVVLSTDFVVRTVNIMAEMFSIEPPGILQFHAGRGGRVDVIRAYAPGAWMSVTDTTELK